MAQTPGAELVLTHSKVITADEQFSVAEAVAIRGDRIVAVGTSAAIVELTNSSTGNNASAVTVDFRGTLWQNEYEYGARR